jgi:hypothetical protein
VMGYAAILWFERGERLTSERMGQVSRGVSTFLLERLKGLGRRRPSRRELAEHITQAIEQSPLSEERSKANQPASSSSSRPSG